jgi:hypothetical protein
MCPPDEAFSTPLELKGPLRRLRELKIVRWIPDSAGSSPALRGMRPDLNITTVRYFLPLALSRPGPTLSTVNLYSR